MYRKIHSLLLALGIEPVGVRVGEYSTSMEMAGVSLSMMLLDDELESLLFDAASTPFVVFEQNRG